ncbi:MAG: hypothetical protein ABJE47_23115 [bacterium]
MRMILLGRLGTLMVVATLASASLHRSDAQQPRRAATSPCPSDSNYQRLAFWVGDWEVVDSTGAHYATQRVRTVVEGCAITVDWAGRAGDKGLSVFGFDARSAEWRQIYVSNQAPFPSGVPLRKSDPSYSGPGLRFIALLDQPAGNLAQSRVTIMPMSDRRVMQLFENSKDGGKTWQTVFKGENRPQ